MHKNIFTGIVHSLRAGGFLLWCVTAAAVADIDLCIEAIPLTLDQTILSHSITGTGLYPLLIPLGPTVSQVIIVIIMYLLEHKSISRTRGRICQRWGTRMSVMGQV